MKINKEKLMQTIKYNKLIRDNIPEIITKSGKQFKVSILDSNEYINKLKEKLKEEAEEVYQANEDEIINELADVLEVIEALEKICNIDHNKLLEVKEAKAIKNGKFDKKLLLEEVIQIVE